MKKTSLYEAHIALNAKMAPFAGFDMPIQYTSVKDESLAIRNNCGVFDVGHMGEFFIEGPDAENFVDYLVTNDIKSASPQKAIYSPLCREDGTTIDDLIVYKLQAERILICVNASNMEKDWAWMSKQYQQKKWNCTLTNKSEDYSLLAVQGPETEKILESLSLFGPLKDYVYYSARDVKTTSGESIIMARTGYTGEDGFEIFCSHSFAKSLWEKLLKQGVVPCGLAARDLLRIEACYPLYGHELSDDLTPLDAGLSWTVKFSKTDFIGKTALQSYAKKYRLVKLSIEGGIPRQNYFVENENNEQIGQISSGTLSAVTNKGIALAFIKAEAYPQNEKFLIDIREKKYQATFHKSSFVKGGHK